MITGVPEEINSKVAISCYPNPFTREVSVQPKEPLIGGSRVEVMNSIGQRVYEYTAESSGDRPLQLGLENLKAGYYIMRISNAKKVGSCKIMKK